MNTGPLGTPYSPLNKTQQTTPRPTSPTKRRLDELTTRLTTINKGPSDERSSRLDTIINEVRALQKQVNELQENKASKCKDLTDRLQAYEQSLTDSQTVLKEVEAKTNERLQALSDHVAELTQQAAAV